MFSVTFILAASIVEYRYFFSRPTEFIATRLAWEPKENKIDRESMVRTGAPLINSWPNMFNTRNSEKKKETKHSNMPQNKNPLSM